ncbi:hypothetical protein BH09ACT1_BH09ACT1_20170 [soil metagenome]
MKRGFSADQVRAAEAPHLAVGEPLMRVAAAALAAELRQLLIGAGNHVLVLAGSGNNGGDALWAAAELAAENVDVAIIRTGSHVHEESLAAAIAAGARVVALDEAGGEAANADVIVDGILGTGSGPSPVLRGDARLVVADVLAAIRQRTNEPQIVAVDLPSGIDPDDGSVADPLVLAADVTLTFGAYKAGLLLAPASLLCGRVILVDIGLGAQLAAMEPLIECRNSSVPE